MKKLFSLLTILSLACLTAQSQDLLKKASIAATAGGFDVKSLTSGIMGKLGPSLALTSVQKPGVSNAVRGFLTNKANILPLKQSDPAAYTTRQAGLFGGLKSKLGSVLTAAQLTKFMGMKPKTNDPTNVLSNLFF